ncbi:MAG: hypothetical protein Q9210_006671 [Variospora velana]
MNSNAPRGSFHNPIPYFSEPVTAAATPAPAAQAAVPSSTWTRSNTAPLGSFHNPFPHEACKPLECAAYAAAPAPPSVPASTTSAKATSHVCPPDRRWLPSTAEVDALFSYPGRNNSSLEGTAQHPAPTPTSAPAPISLHRPQASTPRGNSEQPSARNLVPNTFQPTFQHPTNPCHLSSPRGLDSRRVRFEEDQGRAQASQDAAMRAAARARENEAEVHEFTDSNAAGRLGLPYRRPPTPMPRSRPPTAQSAAEDPTDRALQPESRNSSTGSFVDPNTTSGNVVYGRWPSCTVCDDRPATIQKSGICFCDACFGQACAAEELRKKMSRRR